jgi:hypothetical protein
VSLVLGYHKQKQKKISTAIDQLKYTWNRGVNYLGNPY